MDNLIYIFGFCFILANILFVSFMVMGFSNLKKFNASEDKKIYEVAQKNFKYMIICGVVSFISLLVCGTIIL